MKLSVIVPIYNEENTLEESIKRLEAVEIDKEIIIVNDGSIDRSKDLLSQYSDRHLVLHHERNMGKGAAIQTAVKHARGDYIAIHDADLEYDPEDFHLLLKPIEKGIADVVYGSRFTGEHRNLLFWHMVGNKFLTFLTNLLYNTTLSDMETCYKVIKRPIIQGMNLRSRRFDVEPEITAKVLKRGHHIYEVPISYAGRDIDEGKKIGWRDGFVALWTLVKYRLVD